MPNLNLTHMLTLNFKVTWKLQDINNYTHTMSRWAIVHWVCTVSVGKIPFRGYRTRQNTLTALHKVGISAQRKCLSQLAVPWPGQLIKISILHIRADWVRLCGGVLHWQYMRLWKEKLWRFSPQSGLLGQILAADNQDRTRVSVCACIAIIRLGDVHTSGWCQRT